MVQARISWQGRRSANERGPPAIHTDMSLSDVVLAAAIAWVQEEMSFIQMRAVYRTSGSGRPWLSLKEELAVIPDTPV